MLVLTTLGAPERRRFKDRKGRRLQEAEPEPVPTNRATVVRAHPFASADEASAWLAEVQRGLRARRRRAGDGGRGARPRHCTPTAWPTPIPHARDVSPAQALVARIGYGDGNAVAEGRYEEAWELPRERRRTRRSMEAPEERFAALLGAREAGAGVRGAGAAGARRPRRRARARGRPGRPRGPGEPAGGAGAPSWRLRAGRRSRPTAPRWPMPPTPPCSGALDPELAEALAQATEHMEAALRARRLDSAG